MDETLFAPLTTLGASLVLIFGVALLWRRSLSAYIRAFMWQSVLLAAVFVLIGYFGHDPELYAVGLALLVLKAYYIPRLLQRLTKRVGAEHEVTPYVNIATSLLIGGLLVILAYILMRPVVTVSSLPTRGGLPLALGIVFIGLFVLITRKKAITQVVGFLVMENGIALLAVLATYGIPLIVEMGVFLDLLMGILVMQVFIYQIHDTFDSIDVDRLTHLRH